MRSTPITSPKSCYGRLPLPPVSIPYDDGSCGFEAKLLRSLNLSFLKILAASNLSAATTGMDGLHDPILRRRLSRRCERSPSNFSKGPCHLHGNQRCYRYARRGPDSVPRRCEGTNKKDHPHRGLVGYDQDVPQGCVRSISSSTIELLRAMSTPRSPPVGAFHPGSANQRMYSSWNRRLTSSGVFPLATAHRRFPSNRP